MYEYSVLLLTICQYKKTKIVVSDNKGTSGTLPDIAYHSVTLFCGHPIVADHLKLFVGLNVPDDDGAKVPGGVIAAARVVVPDANVLNFTKRPKNRKIVMIRGTCVLDVQFGCAANGLLQ
jgi:hypothetical protein